ncbi:MAG: glycosyltransferase family A protein [Bacteroidales bacterium]
MQNKEITEKPLVSVLMTAYNREKYIAEAIESVLASTYQNWELIVLDDGSKDQTVEIARLYEAKDTRIKVFINERNLGDYPNRNKAASYARGKFIKYLDSDDLIYPHGLEVMVNAMEKFPEAGFGTQYYIREPKIRYPFLLTPEIAFKEHFWGNGFFLSGPSGTIIKKDTFEKIGGFSGKRHLGDTELWLLLGAKYPVVVFQPALIWWRQHENQEMLKEQLNNEIIINRFRLNLEAIIYSPFCEQERIFTSDLIKRRFARKIIHLALIKLKTRLAYILYRKSGIGFRYLIKGLIKPNSNFTSALK